VHKLYIGGLVYGLYVQFSDDGANYSDLGLDDTTIWLPERKFRA